MIERWILDLIVWSELLALSQLVMLQRRTGRVVLGIVRQQQGVSRYIRQGDASHFCTQTVPAQKHPASSHLSLTHLLWRELHLSSLCGNDVVVDATCGNGYDSLELARLLQFGIGTGTKHLYCIDVQAKAIAATAARLTAELGERLVSDHVSFKEQSHETFPAEIEEQSVALLVYNLGYLPGSSDDGTARVVSSANTTFRSLHNAFPLLRPGGLLTVMAYRGHDGGEEEAAMCEEVLSGLSKAHWRVFAHRPLNAHKGPVLFTAYRR